MRYNKGNERFGKDGVLPAQAVRSPAGDATFGVLLREFSPLRLLR